MRTTIVTAVVSLILLVGLSGCKSSPSKAHHLQNQIDQLGLDKKKLNRQLDSCKNQLTELKKQMAVITNLGEEKRLNDLYTIEELSISKYTGIYDKNDDGQLETLTVYLQPMDKYGNYVKKAGKVSVELWDLENKEQNAQLGQWEVSPGNLGNKWFSTFLSSNYRLEFDISEMVEKFDYPLTVKVEFTDILTGRVFNKQKVIEPKKD